MKILELPSVFRTTIRCQYCDALLEIDESDLRVGNFACFYAGETEDLCACFDCGACGKTIRLPDFPIDKLKKAQDV